MATDKEAYNEQRRMEADRDRQAMLDSAPARKTYARHAAKTPLIQRLIPNVLSMLVYGLAVILPLAWLTFSMVNLAFEKIQ